MVTTSTWADPVTFLHDVRYGDLPTPVIEQALRCLIDLAGTAAAGSTTPMSQITREHAFEWMATQIRPAHLMFDGRPASPVGVAFAGAATIDSFDAHDGHALTKGHAGVTVLPALLAFADMVGPISGEQFLTNLVIGYEIATRAGITLHATAADYHSSGAWNALGAAAVGARLLDLDKRQTQEALGIAEYHGPRSPLMRDIDYPTMVKDGSAAGAAAGTSAALLAHKGFTGMPAVTIADSEPVDSIWTDLGERWRITEQYFKLYPVCRWAHPAIRAAIQLREPAADTVSLAQVDHLKITSFQAAVRLATCYPTTTEEAQYSLPFSVATAFVHGDITAGNLARPHEAHPEVVRLSESMVLREGSDYERDFPATRAADVTVVYKDGREGSTGRTTAAGDPDDPLTDAELTAKYRSNARQALREERVSSLEAAIQRLPGEGNVSAVIDALLGPI